MVEETRRLLEKAISAKTPMHRVSIGLTEAEAAAVYAGNEHYQVRVAHVPAASAGDDHRISIL
jgi:hypothetical protein